MLLDRVTGNMTAADMLILPNKPIRFYNPDQFVAKLDLKDWIVQPKWNGHRAIPVCDEKGEVTIFNRHKRTLALAGSHFKWLAMLDLPRPWLLDGELLRDGRLIVWDYGIMGGKYEINLPYITRLERLEGLMRGGQAKDRHRVQMIDSAPARAYKRWMLKAGDPFLEGFVLKNKQATNLWGPFATNEVATQFKYRFGG